MFKHRNVIDDLEIYVPGRPIEDVKREFGLSRVIKLASNENPYGFSPKAREAAAAWFDSAAVYPDGNCTVLRGALSKKFNTPPEHFVFGAGADEIIAMLGKAFINEGDECVTAEITFSQYAAAVLSMGGKMVYAPMNADYGHNLDAVAARITDKTRLVFIANPNNPTGMIHTEAEQADFMKKVPSGCIVIFDEAYAEFADRPDYPDTRAMLKQYNNIVYMKTFSKVYGLASFRVGYAIAAPEIVGLLEKIRCPFNVSGAAQVAAAEAIMDDEFTQVSIAKNKLVKEFALKKFDGLGISYLPTQANFVMINVKKHSNTVFTELMKRGYIIRSGAAFGMDEYIRVTFGTMEQMAGFVEALENVLGV